MNGVFLGVLAVYLLHAIAMHRHAGPETGGETTLHRGVPAPLMPVALFFVYQALSTPVVADVLRSPAVLGGAGVLMLLVMLNQLRRVHLAESGDTALFRLFYVTGGALQTVLLVMAVYMAYEAGVLGRDLFHPQWIILGLVAGHLVFGVSLVFSHRSIGSLREIVAYTADPRPAVRFAGQSPRQFFVCLDISLLEELVYRVAAQGVLLAMTGNPAVAILGTAVVFSVVHRHFFYNHVVDSIEFLAFSILLGALYYGTGSLVLVVLVHTVRNIEIVYFDQLEGGAEAGAERPAEARQHHCDYHRGSVPHAP